MKVEGEARSGEPNCDVLVCFAVRDEAKYFLPSATWRLKAIITGIGAANARRSLLEAFASFTPRLLLTCGYAGGLNPRLRCGDVIFDAETESELARQLTVLGAARATFHCGSRIAVTAAEKEKLWKQTRADAVEMESGVIRTLCRDQGIAAATIRIISDGANSDLPLDFNRLSKTDGNISYPKLAAAIVSSPHAIPKLIRFQRELDFCSRKLAHVLTELMAVV